MKWCVSHVLENQQMTNKTFNLPENTHKYKMGWKGHQSKTNVLPSRKCFGSVTQKAKMNQSPKPSICTPRHHQRLLEHKPISRREPILPFYLSSRPQLKHTPVNSFSLKVYPMTILEPDKADFHINYFYTGIERPQNNGGQH